MELIKINDNGNLDFGNHELKEKAKQKDFEFEQNRYYVKTSQESTKLEKNDKMLFMAVPGATVTDFIQGEDEISFFLKANLDAQIIMDLVPDTLYELFINKRSVASMKTSASGKLDFAVADSESEPFVQLKKR